MLTLPTTPEMESRLEREAAKRGLQPSEYALRLLAESLSRGDDDMDALLDAAMGAFAHVNFSSEDLRRERNEEVERDERLFAEAFQKARP